MSPPASPFRPPGPRARPRPRVPEPHLGTVLADLRTFCPPTLPGRSSLKTCSRERALEGLTLEGPKEKRPWVEGRIPPPGGGCWGPRCPMKARVGVGRGSLCAEQGPPGPESGGFPAGWGLAPPPPVPLQGLLRKARAWGPLLVVGTPPLASWVCPAWTLGKVGPKLQPGIEVGKRKYWAGQPGNGSAGDHRDGFPLPCALPVTHFCKNLRWAFFLFSFFLTVWNMEFPGPGIRLAPPSWATPQLW